MAWTTIRTWRKVVSDYSHTLIEGIGGVPNVAIATRTGTAYRTDTTDVDAMQYGTADFGANWYPLDYTPGAVGSLAVARGKIIRGSAAGVGEQLDLPGGGNQSIVYTDGTDALVGKLQAAGTTPTASTAPAFTGSSATTGEQLHVAGVGFATVGQVVTTTDPQTLALNECAGMWLITATQAPCLIVSHPACVGAPADFTVMGLAPVTAAEAYQVLRAPTPAGAVASHAHAGPSHTHTIS
jgi:hypothetical protein